jgi:hypothetical protein
MLVVDGHRAMQSNLESAIARGLVPRNSFLQEVLHKLPSVPPLLNAVQYKKFREQLKRELQQSEVSAEDILAALWVIVENDCHESRLAPALGIDTSTGDVIVILN